MNSKYYKWMGALLVLFTATSANAQTAPVTLKNLLQHAVDNNYNIQVSKLEEQMVEKQIVEARSRALPVINGNGNVTDNYKRQVLVLPAGLGGGGEGGGPTKLVAGTKYGSALGLEMTQPVLDMAAFTGLKASKAGREYSSINTKQTKEDVIHAVAKQYYQIMGVQEDLKLQQRTLEILEQLVKASEAQYKNGLLRKIDLDRIRVNQINTQSKLTQAQNDLDRNVNQLKVFLGMPLSTPLTLDTLALDQQVLPASANASSFAIENITQLQLIDSEIKLNTLKRSAIRAENYPKLNAFFNYSYNVMSDDFSKVLTGGTPAITYGMGSLGVRLQVPIFNGFSRHSRAAQSSIKIQQLQKQRDATSLDLDASNKNARIQMNNSLITLRAQEENVKLSEEVFHSNRSNYQLGLSSLTDLLDAQTSFLESKNLYTQSILNYKLAEIELMKSDGSLVKLID